MCVRATEASSYLLLCRYSTVDAYCRTARRGSRFVGGTRAPRVVRTTTAGGFLQAQTDKSLSTTAQHGSLSPPSFRVQ